MVNSGAGKRIPLSDNSALHILVIVLATLFVYAGTLNAPFHYDDHSAIIQSPIVSEPHYILSPSDASSIAGRFNYHSFKLRYVTYVTFMLNHMAGGWNPAGYHAVNILLHMSGAALVYLMTLLLFRTPRMSASGLAPSGRMAALAAALIFAAHPVQTGAVSYVWQRSALLAALFYCAACALYIGYRLASMDGGRGRARLWYALALVSAVLAMKSKELAFTLPVVIAGIELIFFSGPLRARAWALLPFALTMLMVPASLVSLGGPVDEVIRSADEATRVQDSLGRWAYLSTELRVFLTYARLLALPVGQNLDYDYPAYDTPFAPGPLIGLAAMGLVLAAAVRCFYGMRREPVLGLCGFAIFWFFVTASVESSVIPLRQVIFEHRLYLPLAGLAPGVAAVAFMVHGRMGTRAAGFMRIAAAMALVLLALAARERNRAWASEIALWLDTSAKSPHSMLPWYNLAASYSSQGMTDEAAAALGRALAIAPEEPVLHVEMGSIYYRAGQYAKSAEAYGRAVSLAPSAAEALAGLGMAEFALGNYTEATEAFTRAIAAGDVTAGGINNLALSQQREGDYAGAERNYRQALALDPGYLRARVNLGRLYNETQRPELAVRELEAVLESDPGNQSAADELGRAYVMMGMDETEAANKLMRLKGNAAAR